MSVIILDPPPEEEEEENRVSGYRPKRAPSFHYAQTPAGLTAAIEHLRRIRSRLTGRTDEE